jgi:dihydrofolate reductase
MAKLIYSAITSLDGYVADEDGNFDWAAPDEEVHTFVNDVERRIGTYLYGRRMYDVMRFWETPEAVDGQPPFMQDYAEIWRAADKVVYSRTLEAPSTDRTRIDRDFDADDVRRLKMSAQQDLSVGGPGLAAEAIRAGLVDEWRWFVTRSSWEVERGSCPTESGSSWSSSTSGASPAASSTSTTGRTRRPRSRRPTGGRPGSFARPPP